MSRAACARLQQVPTLGPPSDQFSACRAVDPGKGFSWIRNAKPYLAATRLSVISPVADGRPRDWRSVDRGKLVLTRRHSLWRVLTGTPFDSSRSESSMHASTRSGITPKYWSSNSGLGGLAPKERPAADIQVRPG